MDMGGGAAQRFLDARTASRLGLRFIERLAGWGRSIYRRWSYDSSPYFTDIPKSIRKGMTWEQTQAMRVDIWKQRNKGKE